MRVVPQCPLGTCRQSITEDRQHGLSLSVFPHIKLSLCQMSCHQIWCCKEIAIIFIRCGFFFPLTFGFHSFLERIPPGGSENMCHPNQEGRQYCPPLFHWVGKMIQVWQSELLGMVWIAKALLSGHFPLKCDDSVRVMQSRSTSNWHSADGVC